MTTRTLTREETLTVLKHLATGKAHHVVASIAHVNVKVVQEIGDEHGYPDKDQLAAAAAKLEAELEQGLAPVEHPQAASIAAHAARPTTAAPTRPAAGASTPSAAGPDLRSTTKAGTFAEPFPRVDHEQTVRLRNLINTAKGIPNKRIQRQLERALDALTTLQTLVDADIAGRQARERAEAEKATARAEVERLKKQLAAAQAKLRGPAKPRATTAAASQDGDGPTAKEIRTWAHDQGLEVPDRGRIPADVRTAYDEANPQHNDAA